MKIIVVNPKARDDNVNEVFEGRIGEMFAHGLAQKMGGVMITQIGKRRMKMSAVKTEFLALLIFLVSALDFHSTPFGKGTGNSSNW